ncbi:MAG: hypothetical protein ACXAC5_01630 [Promethearchaeota archaeon]|jgi:hypothetical protein
METFKEIILTRQGFWYRRYEEGVRHKRISPQSYRAGVEVGMMTGFVSGCFLCLMAACLVLGTGILR